MKVDAGTTPSTIDATWSLGAWRGVGMAQEPTPQPVDPQTPLTVPLVVPKSAPNAPMYLVAVLAAMLFGTISVVGIAIARPDKDNVELYVTVLGFLGSTLAGALAYVKSREAVQATKSTATTLQEVHLSINSRFDKFADQIKASSFAEGVKAAEDEQKTVDIDRLTQEKADITAANLLEASKAHSDTPVPPPDAAPKKAEP